MKTNGKMLRILYAFAGVHRQSDMGECFRQLAAQHGDAGIQVHVEELEILRGGDEHNLLDVARQGDIIQSIASGNWDLILAAPPCNTFSRAVFGDRRPPNPVRDQQWPWGFPWLSSTAWSKAKAGNELLAFSIRCMQAVIRARDSASFPMVHGWLEFPEDLGSASLGEPASRWQLPEARALEGQVFRRGSLYQCDWADLEYAKPTGVLTTIRICWSHDCFYLGWLSFNPWFNKSGKFVPRLYQGPLPSSCSHGGHKGLKGRNSDGDFNTAPTGA